VVWLKGRRSWLGALIAGLLAGALSDLYLWITLDRQEAVVYVTIGALFAVLAGGAWFVGSAITQRDLQDLGAEPERQRSWAISPFEGMLLALGLTLVFLGLRSGNVGTVAAGASPIALALMWRLIRRNSPR
jgi:uncharacterized membrane protein